MIEKYGVDALRLWMYTVNQPGDSKNFDEKTVDELVKKVFNPIENILSFYKMYKVMGDEMEIESQNVLDRWIISLLNKLLSDGEKQLDNYQIFEAGRSIRDFVNDFSTWYIRRSRERFKSDNMSERVVALSTTRIVLLHFAKYLAPFAPFFAEYLYSEVRRDGDPESVHLANWSKAGEVDDEVLQKMAEVRRVVSLALEKRMSAGIKVRQPLQQLKAKSSKLKVTDQSYLDLIKDEVNIKEIEFDQNITEEVWLDTNITLALQNEGNVREFIRTIQDFRKEKQLLPTDLIDLCVDTDEVGRVFLEESDSLIKKPTNISKIFFQENDGQEIQIQDLKFKIFIKKT
jgi:isoleucyl-tRNA synthetase